MVLRTVFHIFLSHKACVSCANNVRGELNVIDGVRMENLAGGAALQVMAGTPQSTLGRLGKASNLSSLS